MDQQTDRSTFRERVASMRNAKCEQLKVKEEVIWNPVVRRIVIMENKQGGMPSCSQAIEKRWP